ncbi:hypothetical protein SK128_005752 [Halocaridina rubra]|uniref:Uncharacterized protein n=1 Tax=Halocaridina rubra TaxID=373956 RepID=A0AAN8XE91_HALRR
MRFTFCKLLVIVALCVITETAPGLTNKELIAEAIHGVLGEKNSTDHLIIVDNQHSTKIQGDITDASPGDSLIIVEKQNFTTPPAVEVSPSKSPKPLVIVENTHDQGDSSEVVEEDSLLIVEVTDSAAAQGSKGSISSVPGSLIVVKANSSKSGDDDVDLTLGEAAIVVEEKNVTALKGPISESTPAESLIIVKDPSSEPLLFNLEEPDYVAIEFSSEESGSDVVLPGQNTTVLNAKTHGVISTHDRDTALSNSSEISPVIGRESFSETLRGDQEKIEPSATNFEDIIREKAEEDNFSREDESEVHSDDSQDWDLDIIEYSI